MWLGMFDISLAGLNSMKIKLATIRGGIESFKKLLTANLPIKLAYSLSKSVKKLEGEVKIVEEQRIALLKKYGTSPDEKGNVTVLPENIEFFVKDFNGLLEVEVDIDITPVKLSELGDIKLSAVDLSNLEGIVVED